MSLVMTTKPGLTFFRVFGALCYSTNDSEDLGKLQPTADIGIFVGYAPSRKGTGPAPTFLMPGQISSGLVLDSVPAAPYVPLTNKELEILFQPIHSPSSLAFQSPSLHTGVEADSTLMEDNSFAPVDNHPFINVFASKPSSEVSSFGDLSSTESPYVSQTLHHLRKWSKDHPLDNIIGNPSWSVSTRKQLATDALFCQLDEQWLDLTKDTLRDALNDTIATTNALSSHPQKTPDVLIKFVNDLCYPKVVRTLSDVVTNDMFQPWRALTTIINLCLTGNTLGFERPRAPLLQILWGVVNQAHIDYAERMWEEFTPNRAYFIEDKKNLARHTQGRKKANLIVIPSVRFTKLIIHHLQSKHKFHPRPGSPLHLPNEESVLGYLKFSAKGTKREVFGMPIPNNLITADIQGEQYYNAYLEKATKPKATKKSKPLAPKAAPVTKPATAEAPKPTASQPPKPTPATTEPSKKDQSKKRKLVKESSEAPSPAKRPKAGVPVNEPRFGDEEADMQKVVEESLKDVHAAHQGKGKEKVDEEQAAQVLLNLQTLKKKSPANQFIFQRRTPAPTEPSGLEESSSLYAELGLTDSETESDDDVTS
ncbi:hypothetical protein Tco_0169330 [Tanacetum coccineum]